MELVKNICTMTTSSQTSLSDDLNSALIFSTGCALLYASVEEIKACSQRRPAGFCDNLLYKIDILSKSAFAGTLGSYILCYLENLSIESPVAKMGSLLAAYSLVTFSLHQDAITMLSENKKNMIKNITLTSLSCYTASKLKHQACNLIA